MNLAETTRIVQSNRSIRMDDKIWHKFPLWNLNLSQDKQNSLSYIGHKENVKVLFCKPNPIWNIYMEGKKKSGKSYIHVGIKVQKRKKLHQITPYVYLHSALQTCANHKISIALQRLTLSIQSLVNICIFIADSHRQWKGLYTAKYLSYCDRTTHTCYVKCQMVNAIFFL